MLGFERATNNYRNFFPSPMPWIQYLTKIFPLLGSEAEEKNEAL